MTWANVGHVLTKSVNDAKSEHFPLTLTQPSGHYHKMRSELVGTPVGPTYLLEHSLSFIKTHDLLEKLFSQKFELDNQSF